VDKYFGEWIPYSGNSAIILGVVLLVIAGVFALSGFMLKKPLRVKVPGKAMTGMLVAVWLLSILTFLITIPSPISPMKRAI
jgi:cytochrome c oxidase assembly factor CtaG